MVGVVAFAEELLLRVHLYFEEQNKELQFSGI